MTHAEVSALVAGNRIKHETDGVATVRFTRGLGGEFVRGGSIGVIWESGLRSILPWWTLIDKKYQRHESC